MVAMIGVAGQVDLLHPIGRQAALWLAAQDPAGGAVGFDTLGRFERDGRDRHTGGPVVRGLLDQSWDAFWQELA